MTRDTLVGIYVVAIQHLDPSPPTALSGRFVKVLQNAKAKGRIAVRARMITAVAQTQYQTRNGLPVSLIGLHGKDELLVVGPAWALERIGAGEYPSTKNQTAVIDNITLVKDEIAMLEKLPALLGVACEKRRQALNSGDWPLEGELPFAIDALCAFFRTSKIDHILDFFEENDLAKFIAGAQKEALDVLASVQSDWPELDLLYPKWWADWEPASNERRDRLITSSGRHVTAYPVAGKIDQESMLKDRKSNRLKKFLEHEKQCRVEEQPSGTE